MMVPILNAANDELKDLPNGRHLEARLSVRNNPVGTSLKSAFSPYSYNQHNHNHCSQRTRIISIISVRNNPIAGSDIIEVGIFFVFVYDNNGQQWTTMDYNW